MSRGIQISLPKIHWLNLVEQSNDLLNNVWVPSFFYIILVKTAKVPAHSNVRENMKISSSSSFFYAEIDDKGDMSDCSKCVVKLSEKKVIEFSSARERRELLRCRECEMIKSHTKSSTRRESE